MMPNEHTVRRAMNPSGDEEGRVQDDNESQFDVLSESKPSVDIFSGLSGRLIGVS